MKFLEKLMGMSEGVWQRHTNPLSGWSRMSILPLFALAIWSRVWLGWWCLAPLAVVLVWTWWNPRAFRVPQNTDNWMSKGVLGERVWLNRNKVPIPTHHLRAGHLLSLLPLIGLAPFAWGLVKLDLWATMSGMALTMIAKLWFLDRMVWLFDEMVERNEVYRGWLR